jgi:hypothetical protein
VTKSPGWSYGIGDKHQPRYYHGTTARALNVVLNDRCDVAGNLNNWIIPQSGRLRDRANTLNCNYGNLAKTGKRER